MIDEIQPARYEIRRGEELNIRFGDTVVRIIQGGKHLYLEAPKDVVVKRVAEKTVDPEPGNPDTTINN